MAEETDKKPRFNQEQYEILQRCSFARDMKEWYEYRNNHSSRSIDLEEADFNQCYFSGADFRHANLKGANFMLANLKSPPRDEDHKTNFWGADLSRTTFQKADLQGVEFAESILRGAQIQNANLKNTLFYESHLESAQFNYSIVDGQTYIVKCSFDENTEFKGVGLDAARIAPELKAALKNNIRRKQWQKLIDDERKKGKCIYPLSAKLFWWVSDYGSSTQRIIKTFFFLAISFGVFYWSLALFSGWNGIIENLWQGCGWIGGIQTFFRSLYFLSSQ